MSQPPWNPPPSPPKKNNQVPWIVAGGVAIIAAVVAVVFIVSNGDDGTKTASPTGAAGTSQGAGGSSAATSSSAAGSSSATGSSSAAGSSPGGGGCPALVASLSALVSGQGSVSLTSATAALPSTIPTPAGTSVAVCAVRASDPTTSTPATLAEYSGVTVAQYGTALVAAQFKAAPSQPLHGTTVYTFAKELSNGKSQVLLLWNNGGSLALLLTEGVSTPESGSQS